jgi:hypothetical protein
MWTIEAMAELNLKVGGTCFSPTAHPERSFDPEVYEGPGGVWFVFHLLCPDCKERHYAVRRFVSSGPEIGHTDIGGPVPSKQAAHAVAAALSTGKPIDLREIILSMLPKGGDPDPNAN